MAGIDKIVGTRARIKHYDNAKDPLGQADYTQNFWVTYEDDSVEMLTALTLVIGDPDEELWIDCDQLTFKRAL